VQFANVLSRFQTGFSDQAPLPARGWHALRSTRKRTYECVVCGDFATSREWEFKLCAQGEDVLVVVFVAFVGGMEFDHSCGGYAPDRSAADCASPRERIKWIGNAGKQISLVVEFVGMDVDEVTFRIAEDEIVRMRIFARSVGVTTVFKDLPEPWNVAMLNSNVEILMRSGLPTEKCVYSPASINDDIDSVFVHQIEKDENVVNSHP
jgi:hypothetical protein